MKYSPAVTAVSCILSARQLAKFKNVWNAHLEHITTMEYEQVKECYELLMKEYNSIRTSKTNSLSGSMKVLELNQNIGNQLLKDKKLAETTCKTRYVVPKTKEEIFHTHNNLSNVQVDTKNHHTNTRLIKKNNDGKSKKVQLKENKSKFNIKAKREEIESLKKIIKDRLISLNNKSRTIEMLLYENNSTLSDNVARSYGGVCSRSMIDITAAGTQELTFPSQHLKNKHDNFVFPESGMNTKENNSRTMKEFKSRDVTSLIAQKTVRTQYNNF
jgi:hypothetical protein